MSYPYDTGYAGDSYVQDALVKKLWSKALWAEAQTENYFAQFTGKLVPSLDKMNVEGFNNIICQMDDLTKDSGDAITVPLVMKLVGAGVTGDNTLEGNEEKMTLYDWQIIVEQYRHAVRLKGKKAEQDSAVSLRPTAKALLKTWLAEKRDTKMFDALSYAPTSGRHLYAGDATSLAELEASDTMSTTLISKAKLKAGFCSPKIRPVIIKGKKWFVMLVSPFQANALKNEDTFVNAQKDALPRGVDHPIFTGALGAWDGVVIHEHENVWYRAIGGSTESGTTTGLWEDEWLHTATGSDLTGTTVIGNGAIARALFLGAQAGVYAYAQLPDWVEEVFDYKNKWGYATSIIFEAGKPKFNGEDYGVIAVDTAITIPEGVV